MAKRKTASYAETSPKRLCRGQEKIGKKKINRTPQKDHLRGGYEVIPRAIKGNLNNQQPSTGNHQRGGLKAKTAIPREGLGPW